MPPALPLITEIIELKRALNFHFLLHFYFYLEKILIITVPLNFIFLEHIQVYIWTIFLSVIILWYKSHIASTLFFRLLPLVHYFLFITPFFGSSKGT